MISNETTIKKLTNPSTQIPIPIGSCRLARSDGIKVVTQIFRKKCLKTRRSLDSVDAHLQLC